MQDQNRVPGRTQAHTHTGTHTHTHTHTHASTAVWVDYEDPLPDCTLLIHSGDQGKSLTSVLPKLSPSILQDGVSQQRKIALCSPSPGGYSH